MKLAGAAILLAAIPAAVQAQAAGEISCLGKDDDVSISMLGDWIDGVSIHDAVIRIRGETWSTDPGLAPGTPTLVDQAFERQRQLFVSFTFDSMPGVVAKFRTSSFESGDMTVDAMFSTRDGDSVGAKSREVFLLRCSFAK